MPTPSSIPCVNVAGKVQIWVGTGASAALELLGYSVNGVNIVERPFFTNVPGDENGGDEGPPVDKQFMGELHYVRLEMGKFDDTIFAKIRAKLRGNTEASSFVPGTLVSCGGYTYRLLLQGVNFTRNYLVAVPSEPYEINVGTRWSRAVIEFECHRNSAGVMWNGVTT